MLKEINLNIEKKDNKDIGYVVHYKSNNAANFTIICLLIVLIFNGLLSTLLIFNFSINRNQTNSSNIQPDHNHQSSKANHDASYFSSLMQEPMLYQKLVASDLSTECICPTNPPPVTIITNKDPVSVLNEQPDVYETYEWNFVCKSPPIHIMTLTIEDLDGQWVGQGSSKKAAKHEAAYKAIKEAFPHLLEQVLYEPIDYGPKCNDLSV